MREEMLRKRKKKQSRHPPVSNPGLPGLRRIAQPTELHAMVFRLGSRILLNEHYITYKHNKSRGIDKKMRAAE